MLSLVLVVVVVEAVSLVAVEPDANTLESLLVVEYASSDGSPAPPSSLDNAMSATISKMPEANAEATRRFHRRAGLPITTGEKAWG